MKFHFYVRFSTHVGQSLLLSGTLPELGGGDEEKAVPMHYLNDQFWVHTVEVPNDGSFTPTEFRYHYILSEDGHERIQEWGKDRIVEVGKLTAEEVNLVDTWNHAGEFDNAFFTAPFREVLLPQQASGIKPKPYRGNTHVFKVKAPLLRKNEVVCILGSAKALGAWDSEQAVPMTREKGWWTVKVDLSKENFPVTYKYGIYQTQYKQFVEYERGNNRFLIEGYGKKKVTILHDGFAQFPNNTWKGAGVAIPVFSLRTQKSFGCGEFTDLIKLVDWAKATGLKMVQILPVNDTTATGTWQDSYPYAAISAFALHPIYVNLEKIAGKEFAASIRSLKQKQQELNALPDLDYEQVMSVKMDVLRSLYELLRDKTFASPEYLDFFRDNRYWLVPYAAWSHLREKYGTPDATQWKQYADYDEEAIAKLTAPDGKAYPQIALHYFIQFHLHLQLRDAHDHAHKQGIIFKGDIPIGVNRHGVDAWMEPGLYNMDMQAGAPPDDFAVKGQNWGFPTYNWSRMHRDGYLWWKRRFEQMSRYFDAFRIDHILGFFRIWSIPLDAVEGIMGHFVPAIPVDIREFHQRGIHFDHYRYTRPYITDAVLWERFGQDERLIKPYLVSYEDGSYALKPEFSTQRLVEDHFASRVKGDDTERIKYGLFDLISNVLMFDEAGSEGTKFHFRFGMAQTASYRHLPWDTQQKLQDLYIDYFFRRQDEHWKHEAMQKLPALKRSTDMLICGEDLGLVPSCVADVMKQLGILSLEIQRMPKDPKREFFHPQDAPYLSVVTPSTHDMSTVRGWWEEDRAKTSHFFRQELGQNGEAPYFCEPWISRAILLQHLYSPAMWAVFQLQDIMGISGSLRREDPHAERINVPANPKHYWRYRMHLTLEQLIKEEEFTRELHNYVSASGRLNP